MAPQKPRNIEREGAARKKRVAATKAAGATPRSGQSFDLIDELNAQYESGQRAKEADYARERRKGYKAGGVDARRNAPAVRQRPPSPSATSAGSGGGGGGTFSSPDARLPIPTFDRQSSARIIIVATALAGIGAVARDVINGPVVPSSTITTVGGDKIKAPAHLHSLAGVLIAGTVALIVNEFSPQIGMALGVLLVFDVGVGLVGKGGLVDRLGKGVAAGGTAGTPAPTPNRAYGTGSLLGPPNPATQAGLSPVTPITNK